MSSDLIVCKRTKRFSVYSIISLFDAGINVLNTADTGLKASLTLTYSQAWKDSVIREIYPNEELICPSEPARPVTRYYPYKEPETAPSADLTWNPHELNQKVKSLMKKNAVEYTIHGIANAESYAIDLFWDLVTRFHESAKLLPIEFFNDMVFIIEQEALHYNSWKYRLDAFGLQFGCFPFQDGLWQSAKDTAGDILARLSVINLTHEAKGLDTYMKTKEKFQNCKDEISLATLERNYRDEIGHVRFGLKWFKHICAMRQLSPIDEFQTLSRMYFKGKLKEPFNREARNAAGLTEEWYMPLTQ